MKFLKKYILVYFLKYLIWYFIAQKKIKAMLVNYKILVFFFLICQLLIMLLWTFSYEYIINNNIYLNSLENLVASQKIMVERSSGFINLYLNGRCLKSYPVNLMLIYNYYDYNGNNMLKIILEDCFKNFEFKSNVYWCRLGLYKNGAITRDTLLNGETVEGKYGDFNYKLIIAIQEEHLYKLHNFDKLWPFLERVIKNSKLKNYNNLNILEGKLSFTEADWRMHTGFITGYTDNADLLYKYCKENYQQEWKNNHIYLVYHKDKKEAYKLLIINRYWLNHPYFRDYFYSYYPDLLNWNINEIEYLKKIYTKEWMKKEIYMMKKIYDKNYFE